jgi:hypothetical protein
MHRQICVEELRAPFGLRPKYFELALKLYLRCCHMPSAAALQVVGGELAEGVGGGFLEAG